ncbi:MAG: aconitate hydratase [Planctomycetes bacterium]|nr:aconitate hydratase [Planctomycetota bacterium]
MAFDSDIIASVYNEMDGRIGNARKLLGRPLTVTEKILYAHLDDPVSGKAYERGSSYVDFRPDRVAMQDATAQMALLQFMMAGKEKTEVPATVHCDHLILAKANAAKDLEDAKITNKEVFDFLASASNKYGIGFWKPGAGIIHQVLFENYAFPGGMMIGTDSHTPNAGGLGMIAVGVGGADAVDVMAGMPWELQMPKVIGIRLTGKMTGWTSAKDVILAIAGILTVKGGTGCIVEYFGDGAREISCTGKGTICNMGAEIGATTSIFEFDEKMKAYLEATGRADIALLADEVAQHLRSDEEVHESPEEFYDQVITLNLSELEPHVNGPFTPDLSWPISKFTKAVKEQDWPDKLDVGLIGSCTNSSYEDIGRSASVAGQALTKNLKTEATFTITPGSEQVRFTTKRDGFLDTFEKIGGLILANACGPCIGQWQRHNDDQKKRNSIITSFNRNFKKRNDGNPNTYAFVASPEIVTAMVLGGRLSFNPLVDVLINEEGKEVVLDEPEGAELPDNGFEVVESVYVPPARDGSGIEVNIDPNSKRLELLSPFPAWEGEDVCGLRLFIKAKGKCTTDHISMAGYWLMYRGHLDNISQNLMLGAVNYFNDKVNLVKNLLTGSYDEAPKVARYYKNAGIGSIIIGDENYGEGSSREHAAMEPRHMGIRAVIVRSFARIHETNLKKQGVLALTFTDPGDYEKVREDDGIDILGLKNFTPDAALAVRLNHEDGSTDKFQVNHTYNQSQIEWFKAGSALNLIRKQTNK